MSRESRQQGIAQYMDGKMPPEPSNGENTVVADSYPKSGGVQLRSVFVA